MGDEARIHVEPADAGGTEWSGSGAASRRVVHEPSRRGRVAAVVVLAGLVVGGLALSLGGNGADDGRPEPPQEVSARDAYLRAIGGLGRARSFAYHGTVRAAGPSQLQPGTWLADEVTVEGAVLLPHSITREVATVVDDDGVVETVTSGATVWSRTAANRSDLAGAPWERVAWQESVASGAQASFEPGRLGIARLLDVLRVADDRRRGPADGEGNRTLLATVPTAGESRRELGDLAGAEVVLVVDEGGDISDITLTSTTADGPRLVELAVERLGEPGLITPTDVGRPVRSAVPVADIAAAGVRPLELSELPSGWALTSARETIAGPSRMCGTGPGAGGCSTSPQGCLIFQLGYNDLTEVLGGRMTLSLLADGCIDGQGADAADSAQWGGEPFRAGRFTGWVVELPTETNGTVSDGETTVEFRTDLSVADAGAVLATLVPFEVTTEPAVLPGIPSS